MQRDFQSGLGAYVAPFLCHPSVGSRRELAAHSRDSGPQQSEHDCDLHSYHGGGLCSNGPTARSDGEKSLSAGSCSMLELADIVRAVGSEERARLAVLPSQKKALQAIEQCRTPALGGQLFRCNHCGVDHYSYHSCGNRHCPKCHGQQTDVWLEQQRSRLLPCAYYLLTFTLPAELRLLAHRQQKVLYGLLLKCAVASLQKLCRDPQWLGAQPSVLGVLHTWTRAMTYHPHAHFLVSAGGLSADGQRWLEPKSPKFLAPVHALSLIFRAKIRDALKANGLLANVPPSWRSKKS